MAHIILIAYLILGYPLVRFTNDNTYLHELLQQTEILLVTHGDVCLYGLGSTDDFIHCKPHDYLYDDYIIPGVAQ